MLMHDSKRRVAFDETNRRQGIGGEAEASEEESSC